MSETTPSGTAPATSGGPSRRDFIRGASAAALGAAAGARFHGLPGAYAAGSDEIPTAAMELACPTRLLPEFAMTSSPTVKSSVRL